MSTHYLSLILMYILGVMGIYSTAKAIYRLIKYKEIPLIELFYYPMGDILYAMTFGQLISFCMKKLSLAFIIPMTAMASFFVVLDSMLWLNRELGLGLTFLADWYGPNMEILP